LIRGLWYKEKTRNMKLKAIITCTLCASLILQAGLVCAGQTDEQIQKACPNPSAITNTGVPTENQQEDLSKLTPEERKWYKTFQEGTFLIAGWQEISKEILENTPPELREHQRQRLEQLGRIIGMEWCKDNAVRRVDNKMLKEWGEALKKTARTNPEHLPEVIASIDEQLNSILN